MWQFFESVLKHSGFTALLFVLTLVGGFFIVRALWKRTREAEKERTEAVAAVDSRIETVRAEEHSKRSAMREAFEREKHEIWEKNDADRRKVVADLNDQLLKLAEERRNEAERFATRLDELQEKRIEENGKIIERVITHVESTKNTLGKLSAGVDVLIEVTKR